MLGWAAALIAAAYGLRVVHAWRRRDLARSAYPAPAEAEREIAELAERYVGLCALIEIGRSSEGRPLHALRIAGRRDAAAAPAPRLLVTAHIHAVEFIGSFVARRVARELLARYGEDAEVSELLDAADVWFVPLLNPDGARRVWERAGWSGLGGARFTARGVDPNRNFPFEDLPGAGKWNSARARPGAAYYRGPHPLSEPECLALAALAARERFCAAINFHSFGGVVYIPQVADVFAAPADAPGDPAGPALEVFEGAFQSRQVRVRYRPVREAPAAIQGQLDAFLLGAFGTPSVTVEVSRPGARFLAPSRVGNVFWLANPPDPEAWAANDADATIHALSELLRRTGGRASAARQPALADAVEVALARADSAA